MISGTWASPETDEFDRMVLDPVHDHDLAGVVDLIGQRCDEVQDPIVKLTVWAAVESPPTKTSIVVVSMTQSLAAAFQ